MSYIVRPKGMPGYYFCGPCIGFSLIEESAVRYVSLSVAKRAARLIQAQMRKTHPKRRALVAERLS
jgi:hypothetical protein